MTLNKKKKKEKETETMIMDECGHESAGLHSNLTAQGQAVSPTAGEPHATDTASDVSRRDLLTVCRYSQRSFARRSIVLPDVTGSILDLSL